MMDPDLELQGLIVNTLKADPNVAALVGSRVYDTVPLSAPFPYVNYSNSDMVTDSADCIDSEQIFVNLDVWSRAVGYPEAKRIADAVRNALNDTPLSLSVNALVFLEHRQTRTFRDPDGLTSHSVITLEAYVERRAA